MNTTFRPVIALVAIAILINTIGATEAPSNTAGTVVTDEVRQELMAARDKAWRSFFEKDPAAAIEAILAPEVIAIQESSERWESRERLIAMAGAMKAQNVRLLRLEFPRTQIQLFGDTAVLYYSYIFATGNDRQSGTLAGRGTEIFVRRDGRWIDVGWHLDSGAFALRNGAWVRLGDPVPHQQEKP